MRTAHYPSPGAILLAEFLQPLGITQRRLAHAIGVPQRHIGQIIAGKRALSVDADLRLARFFGTSQGYWTGLQDDHDRAIAKDALAETLAGIKPWSQRHAA